MDTHHRFKKNDSKEAVRKLSILIHTSYYIEG